jgi:pyridoxamine 5'-phosphate oxidase
VPPAAATASRLLGAAGRRAGHNESVTDYGKPLREQDVAADPVSQFAVWYREAGEAGLRLAEAAALATASADGAPSLRMVLVKAFDERGFVFFSNYESLKGQELAVNPRGALLFYWDSLGRQVRITGAVERTSAAESDAYVRSRPRESQLSALSSPQSQVIESRPALEQRVTELRQRVGDGELPLPTNWGGFRLAIETVELWQQRHDRLHDRLRYRRGDGADWVIERLAP